jgi:two-component system, chemotaxis family, chemotaxis protein CheY
MKEPSNMRALVVDDSRVMRTIIARIVKMLGFEVIEAGHGLEALELLRAWPDTGLVLVDWNMPVMNGLELVIALRADPGWSALTVVMVTTESELGEVDKALEAGANECVMKPFTPEILLDKLTLLGLPATEPTS